jgi:SAM-dependent methyltransferase
MKTRKLLRQWFNTALGREVLRFECEKAGAVLSNLFGYHIVQLGNMVDEKLLDNSLISCKVVMHMDNGIGENQQSGFISAADSLAIAADCIDVILMPHILEFTDNPHKLLREVERVLIDDGHVVMIGFNPWSLWGVAGMFLAWRKIPPWSGHFYSIFRIRDWLSLLDFEIIGIERFFFRPPLQGNKIMRRLLFMEILGKYCWSCLGGVYIITAKKRIFPLNPIKLNWREKSRMMASSLAKPSTR